MLRVQTACNFTLKLKVMTIWHKYVHCCLGTCIACDLPSRPCHWTNADDWSGNLNECILLYLECAIEEWEAYYACNKMAFWYYKTQHNSLQISSAYWFRSCSFSQTLGPSILQGFVWCCSIWTAIQYFPSSAFWPSKNPKEKILQIMIQYEEIEA